MNDGEILLDDEKEGLGKFYVFGNREGKVMVLGIGEIRGEFENFVFVDDEDEDQFYLD